MSLVDELLRDVERPHVSACHQRVLLDRRRDIILLTNPRGLPGEAFVGMDDGLAESSTILLSVG